MRALRTTAPDIWCVTERFRVGRRAFVNPSELTIDMLGNRFSKARFFLGRSEELAEARWISDGPSERIDVVRSLAVLFEPSIATSEVVLAGRIAVMRANDYDDAGVDDTELMKWYKALTKSLRTTLASPSKVSLIVSAPGKPKAPARGSFMVSKEAAQAVQHGLRLKQFAESNIDLELA